MCATPRKSIPFLPRRALSAWYDSSPRENGTALSRVPAILKNHFNKNVLVYFSFILRKTAPPPENSRGQRHYTIYPLLFLLKTRYPYTPTSHYS